MQPTTPERLSTRLADVGGLPVHRAVPQRALRKVGAWCFLDHLGPAAQSTEHSLQVGPHPHIGLQTFTWMIEGEVLHRDSLGSEQVIRPGQVNLMTAGRGIAHSEESLGSPRIHAAQLWIALPGDQRDMPPRFQHYPDVPRCTQDGLEICVLAGEALGIVSPVQVHSPLVALDLALPADAGVTVTTALPPRPMNSSSCRPAAASSRCAARPAPACCCWAARPCTKTCCCGGILSAAPRKKWSRPWPTGRPDRLPTARRDVLAGAWLRRCPL